MGKNGTPNLLRVYSKNTLTATRCSSNVPQQCDGICNGTIGIVTNGQAMQVHATFLSTPQSFKNMNAGTKIKKLPTNHPNTAFSHSCNSYLSTCRSSKYVTSSQTINKHTNTINRLVLFAILYHIKTSEISIKII